MEAVNRALAKWYGPRRRLYPWRREGIDGYGVLVSEVMLQQTQAPRVAPAFERFLEMFPGLRPLAASSRAEVLRAWGSLGYNRRAVRLHAAAREIVDRYGGGVPSGLEDLRSLPGVGPYTSAAVASIAFGVVVPAIDTNVARVVARVRLGEDGAPAGAVGAAARSWIDRRDPGGWNQALMDLGREVCRPEPRCEECPLAPACLFRGAGAPRVPRRRQPAFHGSFRQVRGAVVGALRARPSATIARLASDLDEPPDRIVAAIRALARDGLVDAGPAALAGRELGRVKLPS